MNYCEKCGNKIYDSEKGCLICNKKKQKIPKVPFTISIIVIIGFVCLTIQKLFFNKNGSWDELRWIVFGPRILFALLFIIWFVYAMWYFLKNIIFKNMRYSSLLSIILCLIFCFVLFELCIMFYC